MDSAFRLMLLLGLVMLCASGRQSEHQVRVPLPHGVSTARCTPAGGDQGIGVGGRALIVQCPAPADEYAKCEFPGAEPRDIALDVLCRRRTLDLTSADTLAFEIAEGPTVRVEWLRISASGEIEALATREFASGVLHLPVAETRTRFLRFSWDGGSILTVPAASLSPDATTLIRKPPAGGELLGLIKAAVVLPDGYRLESEETKVDLRPVGRTLGAAGLPAGRYRLVSEYAGGRRGRVLPLQIERGRSTVVTVEPEPVGAVEAVAAPRLCAETSRLTLTKREERGTRTVELTAARVELAGDCAARVSGLAPGRYRVTFDRPRPAFSASADVSVSAQNEAHVLVDALVVHVFGTVLINEKPALDLTLRFRPVKGAKPSVAEARVGPGGIFDVILPGPGEYAIVPVRRSIALLGSDRTESFDVGPNQLDWSIAGGSVTLKLVDWDKSSPVTVQVNRLQHEMNRGTQSEFRVRVSDPHPVVLDGIGFGGYQVKASQRRPDGDALVSEAREFTIDESDPSEELELRLRRYEARLVLRDTAGEPIRNATAEINSWTQLEQAEPGVFVISGERVVPGEVIQIFAPGFAPTCRLAPAGGTELVVVADAGLPRLVKFTHPLVTKPTAITRPPGRLIVPGAGCSVLLNRAEYTPAGYEPTGTFLFYFPYFPRDPGPQFRWGGSVVTGVGGANGVLNVIRPNKG